MRKHRLSDLHVQEHSYWVVQIRLKPGLLTIFQEFFLFSTLTFYMSMPLLWHMTYTVWFVFYYLCVWFILLPDKEKLFWVQRICLICPCMLPFLSSGSNNLPDIGKGGQMFLSLTFLNYYVLIVGWPDSRKRWYYLVSNCLSGQPCPTGLNSRFSRLTPCTIWNRTVTIVFCSV